MTNNKPKIKRDGDIPILDVARIVSAQTRARLWHRKLGNWRAVGEHFGVNHKYAYDLAMFGKVPSNPDIRVKLGLPKVMPSERKPKAARRLNWRSELDKGLERLKS